MRKLFRAILACLFSYPLSWCMEQKPAIINEEPAQTIIAINAQTWSKEQFDTFLEERHYNVTVLRAPRIITDAQMLELLRSCPNLVELDLSGCTKLTNTTIAPTSWHGPYPQGFASIHFNDLTTLIVDHTAINIQSLTLIIENNRKLVRISIKNSYLVQPELLTFMNFLRDTPIEWIY